MAKQQEQAPTLAEVQAVEVARSIIRSGSITPQQNPLVHEGSRVLRQHPALTTAETAVVDGKVHGYTATTFVPPRDWSAFPRQKELEELERAAEIKARETRDAARAVLDADRDVRLVSDHADGSIESTRALAAAQERERAARAALLQAIEAEEHARGMVSDVEVQRGRWDNLRRLVDQQEIREREKRA